MKATSLSATWLLLNRLQPAGPMVYKELRVASRRRRFYALRSAYVGLLMLVIIQVWFFAVQLPSVGSAVVQASRLGEAGRYIAVTIVWFQFITGQVLAAVLLSNAISSEIRQRTLDALLVTPLGSRHIVVGKLLSRLLQLVLILAIGLPLLAVVRLFGGVPWEYVISCFCITMTAATFAGALSLFSSVTHRHAYEAVVLVGLWYLVVWGLLAGLMTGLTAAGYISRATGTAALFLTNPVNAMFVQTRTLFSGPSAGGAGLSWPLHCLVMLAGAALVLAVSEWRLRRACRVAVPGRTVRESRRRTAQPTQAQDAVRREPYRRQAIRRITGSPIVWKEVCTPLFRTRTQKVALAGLIVVGVGLLLMGVMLPGGAIPALLLALIQIMQLLLIIRLAVSAGGAITREKEARTWPILLTTPLSDDQIVKGKVRGALRRNLPFLAGLLGLYLLAVLISPLDACEIILIAGISLIGMVFFLLGMGVYLSMRLKTTAAAVVATLGVYFVPKFFCCGGFPLMFLFGGMTGARFAGNPARVFAITMALAAAPMAMYVGIGLLCMRAATRRVRRDIF